MRGKFILLIFIFLSGMLLAKNTWQDYLSDDLFEQYQGENELVLEDVTDVLIDVVDDSVAITYSYKSALMLLNEHSKAGSWNSVFISDFEKVSDLEAYSYIPNGKRYKRQKALDIKEVNNISSSVFYDESKRLDVIYPNVKKGTVTTLSYNKSFKDPFFLEDFFFQSLSPIRTACFTVKVHKNIDIEYRLFNLDKIDYEYKVKEKGDYKIYTWEAHDINKAKRGHGYIRARYFMPHVKIFVSEARINGKVKTYYGGMEELYDYYSGFIEEVDTNVDSLLSALCHHLTEGLSTDWDKAKAIYYWVQSNIKYVAYEHGYRGFVPNDPNDIYVKRYGDCKDMTSILVAMLREVGVPAYFSWVGTRHIPYTYQELPTVSVDNHMVAAIYCKGDYYVLDGTMSHYSLGLLPHHIQGKQLFINLEDRGYVLLDLPVLDASLSVANNNVSMTLDSTLTAIHGRVCKIFSSYVRSEAEALFAGLKKQKALIKKVEREYEMGNNSFEVDSVRLSHLKCRDSLMSIDYVFNVDNYCRHVGAEVYVNMNLNKDILHYIPDTTFTDYSIQNDFKYVDVFNYELHVPKGYEVSLLPPPVNIQSALLSVEISYEDKGDEVLCSTVIEYNFLHIETSDYYEWMSIIKQLRKAFNQSIVLVKYEKEKA